MKSINLNRLDKSLPANMKSFEVEYEKFDYFFKKDIVHGFDYIVAFVEEDAKARDISNAVMVWKFYQVRRMYNMHRDYLIERMNRLNAAIQLHAECMPEVWVSQIKRNLLKKYNTSYSMHISQIEDKIAEYNLKTVI